MAQTPDAVKRVEGALALGFSLADALQLVLGQSLSAFGAEHGHSPSEMSMCIRGYQGRVYPEIRDNLAAALGVERSTVDGWIDSVSAEVAA